MATGVFRLAGIPWGELDTEEREAVFHLQVEDGRRVAFVAPLPVAEQISSVLGRMAQQLRQPAPPAAIIEEVAEYEVQKDVCSAAVLLRLVTHQGVPYVFALPPDAAADVGRRLKAERPRERKLSHS